MKHFLLTTVTVLALLTACTKESKYAGYNESPKGFHYKLLSIGESDEKIKEGDFVTADISYLTLKDSVFFEGRRKINLVQPAYTGAIEDCFKMLRNNESASFILTAEPFFKNTLQSDLPPFLKEDDDFKVNITVIDIQTEDEFEKEKQAFLNWINDFGDFEKVILEQFINEEKINASPSSSGLIMLPLVKGNEKTIEPGDTITINYEGRFLNGKFFDSTVRRNQPFQFIYGTEWQVIKGLEEGLGKMHEGEKALFILPSELAFGQEGSSTGIIPPFTSLIFEVEIVQISKGIKDNKQPNL
ncbi:MAG: FKBP-type peptidyl-prolyl cis-trans isomerase [Bacteroidales bacterium]|nr:FKBP-type peptidyl-prolyl cis-trans isomerase [Bacteroidales bacterium]MBN2819283.1 FKBP-type peptidyl-prolyl cis-trans isomerase [Bacteroidales bacterium]